MDVLELAPLDDDGMVYRTHFLDLDGPVRVYRWRDALDGDAPRVMRAPTLSRELDLPFGDGDDHAEGIGLLDRRLLLVVYDSPSPARLITPGTVLADMVPL